MIPSLTQTGRPIGGDLVSLGANALKAALWVDALASTAQQRVPFALVDVWHTSARFNIHSEGHIKSSSTKYLCCGWTETKITAKMQVIRTFRLFSVSRLSS